MATFVVLSGCSAVTDDLVASDGTRSSATIFENATAESGPEYDGIGTGSGAGNNGVYVTDADNDGWQDVLILGGERPVLFRNAEGEFERSGALPAIDAHLKSASVVDYDGDGWEDVILFAVDDNPVALHNDGGTFERVDIGLDSLTYPLGATAADYDGDGDTDLFVYQSGRWSERKPAGYNGPVEGDNGNLNVLYQNTGPKGADRFKQVIAAGISGARWSLAASFVDLTGDGAPDIHVANDYNNDTVYVNRGDGRFEQRSLGNSTARNGMASEIGDVNGDGQPDIFVTNIYLPLKENRDNMSKARYERIERLFEHIIHSERTKGNTLLINQGGGTFVDRADEYGVRHGGWGWAASVTDLDNDGDRDLLHATQTVVRLDRDNPKWTLPMVWKRDGNSFTRVNTSAYGLGEHNGRGLVTLDYDRDGDRDIVITTYDDSVVLYENTVEEGNAIEFEVVDRNGASTLGATVTVAAGGEQTTVRQTDENDFLSQDSRVQHVGLGDADAATLRVTWPDGTERTFEVDANQRLRLTKRGVEVVSTFDRE